MPMSFTHLLFDFSNETRLQHAGTFLSDMRQDGAMKTFLLRRLVTMRSLGVMASCHGV